MVGWESMYLKMFDQRRWTVEKKKMTYFCVFFFQDGWLAGKVLEDVRSEKMDVYRRWIENR
jgi:hypothetical protein